MERRDEGEEEEEIVSRKRRASGALAKNQPLSVCST